MALVPDQKFSTFQDGGSLDVDDIVVGLRDGLNTKFTYTGVLPPSVVVPISQGGTGATTASGARVNLGLGTMAIQNAVSVAITGGSAALDTGSVIAAPVAGDDIANKTYVDSQIGGLVTSGQGTANQVLINGATTVQTGALLFTLPQDIAAISSPTFAGLTLSSPLTPANGGTGVTAIPTSPSATAFSAWDSHVNLSSNAFIPGFSTTVTAGGTTVLTVTSPQIQEFTGTLTQTVTMPVVSTLVAGQPYQVINNSSGVVTVQSSGGNTIQALAANTTLYLICVSTSGTDASSWDASYVFENGAGVLSITGTANQVIASASTGNITLSLPQSIATSSAVTFGGVTSSNNFTAEAGHGFVSNSTTSSLGSIELVSPNNSGNYANILTNLSTTAARTWSLPDESGTLAIAGDIPPNNYVESVVSSSSPVSFGSATPHSITSLVLGPGNWIIGAIGGAKASGLINALVVGVSFTENAFEGDSSGPNADFPSVTINGLYIDGSNVFNGLSTGAGAFTLSAEFTSVYLTIQYNTNGATAYGSGILYAYNY